MKIIILVSIALVLLVGVALAALGHQSRRHTPFLGILEGKFAPCPNSPNCVSSDSRDEAHGHRLWTVTGVDSWELIVAMIASLPETRIIEHSEEYLRAEVHSAVFGFVDDFELNLRGDKLAVRSASRIGYSDFGANRKRVNNLGDLLKSVSLIY